MSVRFPVVAGRTLGVGLDVPWDGRSGFAAEGLTAPLRSFLGRQARGWAHAFFSWQPRDRATPVLEEYTGAWDELMGALPPGMPCALHHTALNLASLVPYERRALLAFTRQLIERYDLKWVNEDVGFWSLDGRAVPYPLPPLLTEGGLAATIANTRECQAGLPVPLLLEFPGFSAGASVVVGDMHAYDFFRRLAEATGAAITLDVGHLLSYQWWRGRRGRALFEELERLPLEHCFELHLSGCEIAGDTFIDAHHGALLDEQYELTAMLLERCPNLRAVTWEDPRFDDRGELTESNARSWDRLRQLVSSWLHAAPTSVITPPPSVSAPHAHATKTPSPGAPHFTQTPAVSVPHADAAQAPSVGAPHATQTPSVSAPHADAPQTPSVGPPDTTQTRAAGEPHAHATLTSVGAPDVPHVVKQDDGVPTLDARTLEAAERALGDYLHGATRTLELDGLPVQHEAAAVDAVQSMIVQRRYRGTGGLRDWFPRTLGSLDDAAVRGLIARFGASPSGSLWREHRPGGVSLEEALFRFFEAENVGDAAVREDEMVGAVVRALAVTPRVAFSLPPQVRRTALGFVATTRGLMLHAAVGDQYLRGPVTPLIASLVRGDSITEVAAQFSAAEPEISRVREQLGVRGLV